MFYTNGNGEEPAPAMSLKDIARREGVSEVAVWRWIHFGILVGGVAQKLLAYKAGKKWRVRSEWYEDFLRRINPDAWRQLALDQEKERLEAKRDQKRLDRLLNEMAKGRRN